MIEYGKIEGTVGSFDPKEDGPGATRITINSPPVESVNNRSAMVQLGMTVGGSSAVNGEFFDRGSKYDYDDWARLGSPEFDELDDTWDWENLYPSFQKASVLCLASLSCSLSFTLVAYTNPPNPNPFANIKFRAPS